MVSGTHRSIPAAVRVRRSLEAAIANGYYAPGAWLPSERVLAEEFGVSRPVIRAALAALQDRGLLERKPGCRPVVQAPDVRPPAIRQDVRSGHGTVAAVLPQHPTYVTAHAILRGITSVLNREQSAYRLAVYDTNPSGSASMPVQSAEELEVQIIEQILDDGAAGMIVWPSGSTRSHEVLSEAVRQGIPVVFVDRYPDAVDGDFVGVDNREGVRTAVEYLLDLGHLRVVYAGHDEEVTTVVERRAGFVEALTAHGMGAGTDQLYVFSGDLGSAMERLAQEWSSSLEPPTAIVFENDLAAFQFMRAAGSAGIQIPRDVSIVGFDDVVCYSPHPAILTTVHQPFWQIGRRAAELLLLRMGSGGETKHVCRHVELPTTLIVRSTTAPPRSGVTAQRHVRRKE